MGIRIIRDVKLYFVGKRAISFRKIHCPPFFSRCFDLISKNDLIGRARTHLVRRDPNRTRHNLDLHTRKRNPNIFSWNKCISFLKKLWITTFCYLDFLSRTLFFATVAIRYVRIMHSARTTDVNRGTPWGVFKTIWWHYGDRIVLWFQYLKTESSRLHTCSKYQSRFITGIKSM